MTGYLNRLLEHEVDPAFKRRAIIIGEAVGGIIKNKKRARLLEVGCGRGFYEYLLTRAYSRVEIVGTDINEEYLKQARQLVLEDRVQFKKANGHSLPFDDKIFDAVVCTEVLEHVEDDRKVMNEMRRVVKPGGEVIISVPVKNYPLAWDPLNWVLERFFARHIPASIWWLAGIWADHVRLYDEDELISRLKETGWQVREVYRCTRWCAPLAHFLLYGIGKNIVELGILKDFNRFNYENRELSTAAKFAIRYFEWWDKKNQGAELKKGDPFVNIVVLAEKV